MNDSLSGSGMTGGPCFAILFFISFLFFRWTCDICKNFWAVDVSTTGTISLINMTCWHEWAAQLIPYVSTFSMLIICTSLRFDGLQRCRLTWEVRRVIRVSRWAMVDMSFTFMAIYSDRHERQNMCLQVYQLVRENVHFSGSMMYNKMTMYNKTIMYRSGDTTQRSKKLTLMVTRSSHWLRSSRQMKHRSCFGSVFISISISLSSSIDSFSLSPCLRISIDLK